MVRVLVVDDDPDVRRVVRRSLERSDYVVVDAADPESALTAMAQGPYAVAILDLQLPGMSGLELMGRLRDTDPGLPVIILTGAGSESERVHGLMSGADDYVVKPFSGKELAARVLAASRRRATVSETILESDGIRIDVAAREAWHGGDLVDLTRREFDLLRHLVEHPGRVLRRADLLRDVWGSSAHDQNEATVTEHVRRLRAKLEHDPTRPSRIVTVRGVGYRLDPPSDLAAAAPRPGAPVPVAMSLAADLSADPSVVIHGEILVHANEAAIELVGAVDVTQVVGRPFLDFIAPQSIGVSMTRHLDAQSGHWPRPEAITVQRLDGGEVPVEVASMPVLWAGEQASQLTLWDLSADTARVRELATGLRSEVAEAVIVTDASLRIRSFNQAAETLYGWDEPEVVGRGIFEVLPWVRDDLIAEITRDRFQREGRWHGEVVLSRRDGTPITVRTSVTMMRDDRGRPAGVVFVDRLAEQGTDRPAGRVTRPSSVADKILVEEIHRGIGRGEFLLRYQPVVELATGAYVGVEALVRWDHPERGLLAPAEFIDVAERSGAIIELGQVVFDEAASQWRHWHDAGIDLHVAVNLSGRQLADPDLTTRIGRAITTWGVPPGALRFEVTETALVEDLAQATAALGRLVDLGAQIAIDDFGTGWASLTYLREFPVHALKIDRVFVNGLGTHAPDTAIVTSIITLGAELGLAVIAEGIESTAQHQHLVALHCSFGQGYLFSKPMSAHDLTGHLP